MLKFVGSAIYARLLAKLVPMDALRALRAAVALSMPPADWPAYREYEPECHAVDEASALVLAYVCEKVYVPKAQIPAKALLAGLGVEYEETDAQVTARPVLPEELAAAAAEWIKAAGLSPQELWDVPIKRLAEEPALQALYAVGALESAGLSLRPSRQLAYALALAKA